mmetsp:Transcript_44146/g.134428  ORF Transcript_44146/g.134428 Transcript_44146/m.134428 type:complete len:269 (+) Transcript_44146:1979-2785(+)
MVEPAAVLDIAGQPIFDEVIPTPLECSICRSVVKSHSPNLIPMGNHLILRVPHDVNKLGFAIRDEEVPTGPMRLEVPGGRPRFQFVRRVTEAVVSPSQVGKFRLRAERPRRLLQISGVLGRGMVGQRREQSDRPRRSRFDVADDPRVAVPVERRMARQFVDPLGAVQGLSRNAAAVDEAQTAAGPGLLPGRREHVPKEGRHERRQRGREGRQQHDGDAPESSGATHHFRFFVLSRRASSPGGTCLRGMSSRGVRSGGPTAGITSWPAQ